MTETAQSPETPPTASPIRLTGGCQCGAVRFSCERLGRASICHCRMCQKAFGAFFGPLVSAHGLVWTRGEPKRFQSSSKVHRGFCGNCGTPLTYEVDGRDDDGIEIAIGAFDDPAAIPPVIQFGIESRLPWFDKLPGLRERSTPVTGALSTFFADIVSYQHPDHDTPEGQYPHHDQ